ncbi:AI-2E family transporter [Periweissella fabaria]|uniref:AI-2E family transporter n=1 Tax=Periweissella fabaria TaxID=546157 RepID=A0ABM8Z503_9LACO|nr:AI-2E family transporter [Periweissella fabaria]MCM0596621.1 AI-2E family transporter [Periweissella fabaria]CAH0416454.1 hypothetical protein WFA24289_00758 [Periweissella fabaria]
MYDSLVRFFKKSQTQVYLTLLVMIVFLFLIHGFLSSILLIVIFAYFGVHASRKICQFTRIPYVLSVIIFYALVLVVLAGIITFIIPVFAREGQNLYDAIIKGLREYPQINHYVSTYMDKFDLVDKISTNWQKILVNGLTAITTVGDVFVRVALAFFLSLIFTITFPKLQTFGKQFEHSDFPKFFKIVYQLTSKFIFILGQIIEVQLVIDIINTILMLIGLTILGMPSPFVLGMLVFVFGLVPVAGVLISSIPLTLIAFSMGGVKTAIELIILICIMHAFEAYVLHPKLMSSRAELPIFVTFAALIIMEHILGTWGLIVGVPIVAFFMDVMNIHRFDKNGPILHHAVEE